MILLAFPAQNYRFRYDLLCIEGISRALRTYLGKDKPPLYKLVYPEGGEANLVTANIAPEVCPLTFYDLCSMIHLPRRRNKSDLSSHVQFSATSLSHRDPMNPSLTFKTSCIKISADVDNLSRSELTTWINYNLRSHMRPDLRRISSSFPSRKRRSTRQRNL